MNYDADSWDTIARELVDNHTGVHQFNRARLLDDAFNLACAGEIDVSIPLNMTKYLEHETEPFPRDTGIFYLKKIILFSTRSINTKNKFKKIREETLVFFWHEIPVDNCCRRAQRARVWMNEWMNELMNEWMKSLLLLLLKQDKAEAKTI